MIAIAVAASKSYLFAWPQCVQSISTACGHHKEAHFIFATDMSKESDTALELAKQHLPEGWKITRIQIPIEDDTSVKYKTEAQTRIASLQGAAFAFARRIKADACLSVESDTLLPANALRVLEWVLTMPDSDGQPYYDIAAATYSNGLFLGGFGSDQHRIAEDFLVKERKVPERLKRAYDACESRLKLAVTEKEAKRLGRLREKVNKCPPDGNIWEITAKHGWRRRGWMDYAYPGIGKGAIVPSDWCGMGCTLMSRRALALADFTGYQCQGTQDLFLCWDRWHPAGLRIACVPHVVCDHIKKEGEKFTHLVGYHEASGECAGHLRVRAQPWIPL